MYAGEDGEVCVELGYLGKGITSSTATQPDKSKAGGLPAWFGEAPVDVDDLVCGLCGRDLLLVTQVYAPTHTQRSLCVFGCNRAACSGHPQGWQVIRTQAAQAAEPHPTQPPTTAKASPPTPPVPPQRPAPAADAWGGTVEAWDASGDGDDWGAETGEWEAEAVGDGGAGEAGSAAIDTLLEEQERRSAQKVSDEEVRLAAGARGKPTAVTVGDEEAAGRDIERNAAAEEPGHRARRCFPAKSLSFLSEPWGAESSVAEDKGMKSRIRRYREQEEDRGLVAALDQALGLKGGQGSNSQGAQGGGGATGVGEKYERTPARAKAVMRFADRVARSPQQIVRYAYGGQPLWSAHDPPKEEVPPCACGAPRVFEMQLMPALLLHLRVNEFADVEAIEADTTSGSAKNVTMPPDNATGAPLPPAGDGEAGGIAVECGSDSAGVGANEEGDGETEPMPTPSADERERLRTWGMDWGVIAVWCCPRSCDVSFEEHAVVQLPV